MLAPQSPGPLLRALRLARRLSQEELAGRAEISTRHLSCLESGRARPSHAMLLLLGAALDLPLRERNNLLVAAGFAPVYRVSPLDDPAMAHVGQAIAHLLRIHEPHPALLLDRAWNILRANDGALRLFRWCGLELAGPAVINVHRVLFDPALGFRRLVVNFDALADATLARLRTEVDVDPSSRVMLHELEHLRGETRARSDDPGANAVALPIHIRRGDQELRYFTTLTTLGTPLDVTAQELRIDGFFPTDDATDAFARQLEREAEPRT